MSDRKLNVLLLTLFQSLSLVVFCYVVFWLKRSPAWFVLWAVVIIFHASCVTITKREVEQIERQLRAKL